MGDPRPLLTAEALFRGEPNPLAADYSRFDVTGRCLLTGHSHQAWPDCAARGHSEAFADAATLVDDKWQSAFAKAEQVRCGYRRLLDDPDGDYALGANTHELLVRLLSALPLQQRPRIVTTDGEFHSASRQFRRLAECGIRVDTLPAHPAADVGERLAHTVDDQTALVMVSTVFFEDAHIAGGLQALAETCRRRGVALLLDVYHQLNVLPFSVHTQEFGDAFVVGGGYKYCQLGEGNAFLRLPPACTLRPVVSGWFAEFATTTGEAAGDADGAQRFAGATYDPTSHYRAARVFQFFRERALEPALLRTLSQLQVTYLAERFDALDLPPGIIDRPRDVPLSGLGGFLALVTPHATGFAAALRRQNIYADARGHRLRLGPAPYVSRRQLDDVVEAIGELAGRPDALI
ncbi:hypothetical protein [Aquisalimonas sp.]|uniref:hypothetical protein n=1 Tax=Aquisalimonas sp. TaxID=1872621 RepID=UPI0025C4567F|nr:hypothetical protein [Aquisalimonas sp.]